MPPRDHEAATVAVPVECETAAMAHGEQARWHHSRSSSRSGDLEDRTNRRVLAAIVHCEGGLCRCSQLRIDAMRENGNA
ncbi:hypothetical protein HN51_069492, partial [Arachis hypogaea]